MAVWVVGGFEVVVELVEYDFSTCPQLVVDRFFDELVRREKS
jgi:hypothetical protein